MAMPSLLPGLLERLERRIAPIRYRVFRSVIIGALSGKLYLSPSEFTEATMVVAGPEYPMLLKIVAQVYTQHANPCANTILRYLSTHIQDADRVMVLKKLIRASRNGRMRMNILQLSIAGKLIMGDDAPALMHLLKQVQQVEDMKEALRRAWLRKRTDMRRPRNRKNT